MCKLLAAELLAGIVLGIAGSSSQAVEQKAIDKAIDGGVKALRGMQGEDGAWPHKEIGATALAGLTLLECGAKTDDKAVLRAADIVRKASLDLTHNYSICLAILFFDRLGDAHDIPLIESLTVRLLASQTSNGGWSYHCPPVSDAEVRRLRGKLAGREELVGRREPPKAGAVKRTPDDLPKEIQQQLALLHRRDGMALEMVSDNSNTQFAIIALWVARRHGLPVEKALQRVEKRFRGTQHAKGGWGYRVSGSLARSTASMTCAGLLGLAVANGNVSETSRPRKPAHDINKDSHVRKGLFALSTSIGKPVTKKGGGREGEIPQVGGRTYYFLGSLERVAVALDLQTIGKKDWYAWGAEILVSNQHEDGSWRGSYADCGADTCFALLFLRRANLVADLTTQLAGRVHDPGERVLKGGIADKRLAVDKSGDVASGVEGKDAKPNMDGQYPAEIAKKTESRPIAKPPAEPPAADKPLQDKPSADKPRQQAAAVDKSLMSPAARMAADLAKSTGSRYDLLLHNYRIGKGAEFTEALALAIPQLKDDRQRKTREALAERLTRMKDTTLQAYLGDEQPEIRIAAARACAVKKSKSLIPRLIPLLRDTRGGVAEAAHKALKELSGQDFGPKADAGREERVQAARQWLEWWNKQSRDR